MSEQQLPTTISVNGEDRSFIDFYKAFASSNHGQKLAGQIRFGRFKPDSVDADTWKDLLGADVDNLRHEKLSMGIARQFVRHCHTPDQRFWKRSIPPEAVFTLPEQTILFATAAKHDEPEAILSDISYDQKTDADHAKEMKVMQQMLTYSLGDADVSRQILEILNDKKCETKLGRAFNAIERIGYLRTRLTAWDYSNCDDAGEELRRGLRSLTNNVLINQTQTLLEYAEIYPAVRTFLATNAERITNAFQLLYEDRGSFEIYAIEQDQNYRTQMETLFEGTYSLWTQRTF